MRTTATTVEHVGEWKVAVTAATLEEVFAETARVIANAAGPPARSEPGEWQRVSVSAGNLTSLLADWANEMLGRGEAEQCAYAELRNLRIQQEAGQWTITADARGTPVEQWLSPLKAATYHGLMLERTGGGWRGIILFDV
jgi:SHS2 domain-containing protein